MALQCKAVGEETQPAVMAAIETVTLSKEKFQSTQVQPETSIELIINATDERDWDLTVSTTMDPKSSLMAATGRNSTATTALARTRETPRAAHTRKISPQLLESTT